VDTQPRVLTDEVKAYVEQHLRDFEKYHPEVEIQEHSVQADHVHMVAVIPLKYSVSSIVGKIKANTSREENPLSPLGVERHQCNTDIFVLTVHLPAAQLASGLLDFKIPLPQEAQASSQQ
jgi:REP element-mobilizing transposase RayT